MVYIISIHMYIQSLAFFVGPYQKRSSKLSETRSKNTVEEVSSARVAKFPNKNLYDEKIIDEL